MTAAAADLEKLIQEVFSECGRDCGVDTATATAAVAAFVNNAVEAESKKRHAELETLRQRLGHAEAALKAASKDATNRRLLLERIAVLVKGAARP